MTSVAAGKDPPHTPLRRRRPTVASSRSRGADTRQGYPQRFDRYLAKPAIHRPQTVPARKRTGLQIPTARTGAAPGALLRDIGVNLPEQAEGSGRAPDNVPTRVNVASQYLGNKACIYGTIGANAPQQTLGRRGRKIGRGQPTRTPSRSPGLRAYTPYHHPALTLCLEAHCKLLGGRQLSI